MLGHSSHVRLFATSWIVSIRLPCPWDSPGKNTGVGNHSLLQGIFLTQGWNPGLLHCTQIPYCLSHQGSPIRREVHIPFLLLFLLLYPNVLSNRHSFVYLFSEQLLRAPLYLTNCLFLGAYESVITDDWSYFKFMSTKVTWVLL